MVETASSTQSDIEELTTEMFKKLDSIESTVDGEQSSVRERRQQLAEYGDILKKLSEKAASDCRVDFARYQPLWTAVYDKNMKAVEDFINKNLETILDAHIDESGSTIFHLIVQLPATELTEALTEKLVSKVQANSLVEQTNIFRMTALHIAAGVGNTKAVELLVKKNKDLLTKRNFNGRLPLSYAIFSGRYKDTVEYLLSDPEGRIENFADKFPLDSAFILFQLIDANHIDLAFGFLNQNPKLADRDQNPDWKKTLYSLAGKDTELPSGSRLGYLQSLIYHYIPAEVEKHILRSENGDIENQTQTSRKAIIFGKLQYMLWNALMSLVPGIKRIQNQKLMHVQTLEIVRLMIAGVTWTHTEALESLKEPVLRAAELGNYMFVEEILRVYNPTIRFFDKHGHTIIHRAVLHRQEKVFNLIYNQLFVIRDQLLLPDDNECNILHLAGKLVPSSRVPGAVLQMQRELQWFKTVEDVFHPFIQEKRNSNGKKPREVFTEEHGKLVKEGEKWMKGTATSCSLVAALIITVVFATAYTFPGSINGEGVPNFFPKTSFKVFLVSIALALFSSTASVQMFLGILTSRYAEEDFLESLPKKLIIGLVTLLFSIATMMLAFASTFHIFLHQPWKWVTFLMAILGIIPVTLFALMQFPLLLDIYKFTYGRTFLRPMK